MKVFNRIQSKLVFAFLLVVLLPLLGTSLYGNWVTSKALEDATFNTTRHQLELLAADINGTLTGLGNETLYLGRLESLADLLNSRLQGDDATIQQARSRLTREFLIYGQNHPSTYQIRYLDETGQEIVRVDCLNSRCSPRRTDQLQNKKHRYYFLQTMELGPGLLYVSPLDLNREFDQIEQPYRPVIRLATPVFFPTATNGAQQRAGIVIINLLAEPVLARIEQANTSTQQIALADAEGYYLAHPEAERRWGGAGNLNTGHGLRRDYGVLADKFFQQSSGTFFYPQQAGWQQLAIQLLPPAPLMAQQRTILFQQVRPFGPKGPTWILISNQPRTTLISPINNFRWTALAILALATATAMAIAGLLARRLTNPISTLIRGARRIEAGEWGHRIKIDSQDEIGDLAVAFNAMAATQQQNLEQLSALYQAGRHIASQLEQEQVLQATFFAIQKMFPAAYSCITLTQASLNQPNLRVERGAKNWAAHRQDMEHQSVLRNCLSDFEWRTGTLAESSGPNGYFCCAPLCGGKAFVGLLEIYGVEPALASSSTGNMLAALAAQASIALENAWLYQHIKGHRAQLQDLVEQLISAQEEERRLLAYDLHDGLIQRLVGARLHLTNFTGNRATGEDKAFAKGLSQLGTAITEARTIIEGLRPVLLDDLGLVEALRQHLQMIAAQTAWQVNFQADPQTMQLPEWIEITAFRITQEALNNIVKHADAQRVEINLNLKDDELHILVRDWGRGFDPTIVQSGRQRHVGLTSMQERARLVGGDFTVESAPGYGTSVNAVLPLNNSLKFEAAFSPAEEMLVK